MHTLEIISLMLREQVSDEPPILLSPTVNSGVFYSVIQCSLYHLVSCCCL